MLGFYEKRRISQLFFSKGMILGLFIMVILMAYATLNAYDREQEARARRTEATDELGRLEARASALTDNINRLEDPRGIEEELRRRYDVGKEGEQVIVFVEHPTVETLQDTPVSPPTLWQRLMGLLTGE